MLQADSLRHNTVYIDRKWVCAKPFRRPFWYRIKDAWAVLKGKAEAVSFYKQ